MGKMPTVRAGETPATQGRTIRGCGGRPATRRRSFEFWVLTLRLRSGHGFELADLYRLSGFVGCNIKGREHVYLAAFWLEALWILLLVGTP